jgi:hypothetical protein
MTKFDYEATDLSYKVEVTFPRVLEYKEQLTAQNIASYWGNIPYVTTEGIYDVEWKNKWRGEFPKSVMTISIDFTKSASDDIGGRDVLELLAGYLENGTAVRVKAPYSGTRKWEGLDLEPTLIRTDFL